MTASIWKMSISVVTYRLFHGNLLVELRYLAFYSGMTYSTDMSNLKIKSKTQTFYQFMVCCFYVCRFIYAQCYAPDTVHGDLRTLGLEMVLRA